MISLSVNSSSSAILDPPKNAEDKVSTPTIFKSHWSTIQHFSLFQTPNSFTFCREFQFLTSTSLVSCVPFWKFEKQLHLNFTYILFHTLIHSPEYVSGLESVEGRGLGFLPGFLLIPAVLGWVSLSGSDFFDQPASTLSGFMPEARHLAYLQTCVRRNVGWGGYQCQSKYYPLWSRGNNKYWKQLKKRGISDTQTMSRGVIEHWKQNIFWQ